MVTKEEVHKDEVVIVQDTYSNYRRTRIPKDVKNPLGTLLDLDGRITGMKFQGTEQIFRIPPDAPELHFWFQVC